MRACPRLAPMWPGRRVRRVRGDGGGARQRHRRHPSRPGGAGGWGGELHRIGDGDRPVRARHPCGFDRGRERGRFGWHLHRGGARGVAAQREGAQRVRLWFGVVGNRRDGVGGRPGRRCRQHQPGWRFHRRHRSAQPGTRRAVGKLGNAVRRCRRQRRLIRSDKSGYGEPGADCGCGRRRRLARRLLRHRPPPG